MSRRISLPGADELFRATGAPGSESAQDAPRGGGYDPQDGQPPGHAGSSAPVLRAAVAGDSRFQPAASDPAVETAATMDSLDTDLRLAPVRHTGVRRRPRAVGDRRPSGRERHEEKITVYVSAEELMDVEQARLTLRGDHGLAVDRGRIVREALAVVLADLEAKGENSILVRRLLGR